MLFCLQDRHIIEERGIQIIFIRCFFRRVLAENGRGAAE